MSRVSSTSSHVSSSILSLDSSASSATPMAVLDRDRRARRRANRPAEGAGASIVGARLNRTRGDEHIADSDVLERAPRGISRFAGVVADPGHMVASPVQRRGLPAAPVTRKRPDAQREQGEQNNDRQQQCVDVHGAQLSHRRRGRRPDRPPRGGQGDLSPPRATPRAAAPRGRTGSGSVATAPSRNSGKPSDQLRDTERPHRPGQVQGDLHDHPQAEDCGPDPRALVDRAGHRRRVAPTVVARHHLDPDAHQGAADQRRNRESGSVGHIQQQSREEEVLRAAGTTRDERTDRHPEEARGDVTQALPPGGASDRDDDASGHRPDQCRDQLGSAEEVDREECDGRKARIDQAVAVREVASQHLGHAERLRLIVVRLPHHLGRLLRRQQLIARVVHHCDTVMAVDASRGRDPPTGLDAGDRAPTEKHHLEMSRSVEQIGLHRRDAGPRP